MGISPDLERGHQDMVYIREGYNGHQYLSHIRCLNTGYAIIETHASAREAFLMFAKMTVLIEKHHGFKIRFVTLDNEKNLQNEFIGYCAQKGIEV
jgi:hypothetical protein